MDVWLLEAAAPLHTGLSLWYAVDFKRDPMAPDLPESSARARPGPEPAGLMALSFGRRRPSAA